MTDLELAIERAELRVNGSVCVRQPREGGKLKMHVQTMAAEYQFECEHSILGLDRMAELLQDEAESLLSTFSWHHANALGPIVAVLQSRAQKYGVA